ncbi:MAG: hypothetical protein JNK21_08105 [Rhodospirillaceae bacterium]|nr:hypothetical protein [Rhodospirillaceae bacterium]
MTRTSVGHIAYVSDRAEDRGRARGAEDVAVSLYADGTRTMRARCLIADPPHVAREVVQTNDQRMNPLDCFVRVRTGDTFTGTAWFRWQDGLVESENFTAASGRKSERMSYGPGPVVFCNHAITGDAWMTAAYPTAQGPGQNTVDNMFSASAHRQGATGPTLNRLLLGIMYLGRETITVGAGTFETNKFRLNTIESPAQLTPEHLAFETWVLTDGTHIPALAMYRGDRRYELTHYAPA